MTSYRAKAQTVEAMQWDGTDVNGHVVIDWAAGLSSTTIVDHTHEDDPEVLESFLIINNPEKRSVAVALDWIVIDMDGNLSVHDPADFDQTFEVVP